MYGLKGFRAKGLGSRGGRGGVARLRNEEAPTAGGSPFGRHARVCLGAAAWEL